MRPRRLRQRAAAGLRGTGDAAVLAFRRRLD